MTVWQRWVAFLSATEDGTSLAIVRLVVGSCVLRTMLSVWWAGIYTVIWYDTAHGGYRSFGDGPWQYELLGGYAPWQVDLYFGVALVGGALVTLGVGGPVVARLLTFATLQGFQAVCDLNDHAGGSYDELVANCLWLLVLAGPSRTLSVHTWWTTGRWSSTETVMFWPRFLFVFQAVVMYATTGWQKLSVHWVPGGDLAALYYIQQQPTWQLRDMSWLAWVFPLTQLATAVSWWWEVTAPVWLLAFLASRGGDGWLARTLRRWRVNTVYLVVGLVFHVLVAATMEVGPFSWASLALYAAFVDPRTWRRWLRLDGGPVDSRPAEGVPTVG
ncbi:MAG: hypothetical protein H6733_02030 [Alphaproteobacteria bacterium]|nr:hypothetical protein [Alphaproteobacteria bacterium]